MEGRDRQHTYAGGLAFSYTLGSRWPGSPPEPSIGGGHRQQFAQPDYGGDDRYRYTTYYPRYQLHLSFDLALRPFDGAQDGLRTGDALYRLISATYSTGEYYHYTYPSTSPFDLAQDELRPGDPVGNRLGLVTSNGSASYEYDAANRLTSVNGVGYTWDNDGNPSG